MLNIDEKQLKLLLEKKKKILERPRYSGIGEIISSVSLMITLFLSDFNNITIVKPLYFKIVAWGISIVIFIYGLWEFIKSITGAYSLDQLYSEIADIDPKVEHAFNIVVIRNKNRNGKYLVFKSKRWKCWLFPNYKCLDGVFDPANELTNIKKKIEWDLNIVGKVKYKYLGNEVTEKYSVSDRVIKKYNFHFFQAIDVKIENDKKLNFKCNGKKYRWMTLDQMYSSKNIVKKNKDVLDYIRNKCDIS